MKHVLTLLILMIFVKLNGQTKRFNPTTFLELNDSKLQTQLFYKIDSITKVQYPKRRIRKRAINLNTNLINNFIIDLDTNQLKEKHTFTQEVQLGITSGKEIDTTCIDDINLKYNANEYFILTISNSFLKEITKCSSTNVLYYFKIENGKILDFNRKETP